MKRLLLSGLFLALPLIAAHAAPTQVVAVQARSERLSGRASLGVYEVPGLGPVRLDAWRKGNQLVIHAFGPDGTLVGQAESVPGMSSTPLYLRTDSGLRRLELRWGSKAP